LQAAELLAAGGTDAAGGFSAADLSEFARASILRAASGVGVCSQCRWQSGCLNCDSEKARRHFLEKECQQWGPEEAAGALSTGEERLRPGKQRKG
jgi:hypothetical protein